MQYEIVSLEEFVVVGIGKKTSNENMQAVSDIGVVWQDFMGSGIYTAIRNKKDHKTIGLYTDYEGDFTKPYLFLACCEVESVSEVKSPLMLKRIPSGRYAKFSIRGHRQYAVGKLWQEIWSMNLDRSYTCDFEVYHNNSTDENDQIIDVYIALKNE